MSTVYSNHQIAKLITAGEYLALDNPEFVGQTRVNEQGQYKMYWKVGNNNYFTENTLL